MIIHVIRKPRQLFDRRGRRVSHARCQAVHESGHAIVALELRIRVLNASIVDVSDDGAGGSCGIVVADWFAPYVLHRRPPRVQRDPRRRELLGRYIAQGVAGYVAERILVSRSPHNFWHDEDVDKNADIGSDAAQACVCARLLGVRRDHIRPFVASFEPQAREILERRWHEVEALADELEKRWREVKAITREMKVRFKRRGIDGAVDGGEVRRLVASLA